MKHRSELDFREMREMLRAMQAGELTVSRGIEILEMWEAGNWNNAMLPPVRIDLIEEDSMPVEIIDRLKDQRDTAWKELREIREATGANAEESTLDEVRRVVAQRDGLLAALEMMNRAYVNLMENGRDRIIMLGGECDPVDVMESNDPNLRESRAAIASVEGGAA